MADKEIAIDHSKLSDSQNITPAMEKEFKAKGLDLHTNEVTSLNDDFSSGKRVITVKNTQYFGGLSERGKINYENSEWNHKCVLRVASNGLYLSSTNGKLTDNIKDAYVFSSRDEAREFKRKRTFPYYCEIEDSIK